MIGTIEMFENAGLARDVPRLKEMIYARAEPLAAVPGLRSKVWFGNPDAGRFGAFLVWESETALAGFRAAEDTDSIALEQTCVVVALDAVDLVLGLALALDVSLRRELFPDGRPGAPVSPQE